MCWACLNANHLDLPISRDAATISALREVTTSAALLATADTPSASWSSPLPGHKGPVIVSYSFLEANELPSTWSGPFSVQSYWSFSEDQRSNFRKALAAFTAVSGIVFVETSGKAMVEAYGASGSDYGGWANFPESTGSATGEVDLVIDGTGRFAPGSYEFFASMHEIGHAVGLKHPFEGSIQLTDAADSTRNTVMSYTLDNTPTALARLDIAALQTLYGRPINTAGWSTYFDDGQFLAKGSGRGDGITGVAFLKNQISGLEGNDTLIGREAADHILGDSGNDRLYGMGGSDRLEGGAGNDLLNSWGANGPETAQDADSLFGGAGNDRLYGNTGAMFLQGGQGNDSLHGSAANASLQGNDGADVISTAGNRATLAGGLGSDRLTMNGTRGTLYGGGGYDYIYGGRSGDLLYADAGGGELHGGQGRDVLRGGGGRSLLYGEAGNDTLYANQSRATAYGGSGDDLLVGREEPAAFGALLYGEAGNDTLSAASARDLLYGGEGDDFLSGRGGCTLFSGGGADTFEISKYSGAGRIVLADFDVALDQVSFTRLMYSASLDGLVFTDEGSNTLVTFHETGAGGMVELLLVGIDAAHASVGKFVGHVEEW